MIDADGEISLGTNDNDKGPNKEPSLRDAGEIGLGVDDGAIVMVGSGSIVDDCGGGVVVDAAGGIFGGINDNEKGPHKEESLKDAGEIPLGLDDTGGVMLEAVVDVLVALEFVDGGDELLVPVVLEEDGVLPGAVLAAGLVVVPMSLDLVYSVRKTLSLDDLVIVLVGLVLLVLFFDVGWLEEFEKETEIDIL